MWAESTTGTGGSALAQRRVAPQRDLKQFCARPSGLSGQAASAVSTWVFAVLLLLL
jgi:hypothetical protein